MRGEPIPERYYIRQERGQLATATDSEKLTVLPFTKEEVRLEVNEPDSHIEWEFEVKAGDIDYSVYFKERTLEEPQQVELVPKHRTDTCHEPEKGIFKCEKVGTLTHQPTDASRKRLSVIGLR
ncbi:hypothetical protein AVEN_146655-1 [Araneus ventricosus]|uniref:Uncharacterized protein n=1 Tax=Araneus ventricosus TaxID=182803 RepID=A0A4Y2U1Z5_ARAVE|nr:hypothetical protein AVEN_146655-1 [Araneus ventricosus]